MTRFTTADGLIVAGVLGWTVLAAYKINWESGAFLLCLLLLLAGLTREEKE